MVDNNTIVVLNGMIYDVKHSPKNFNSEFSIELFAPNHEASYKMATVGVKLGRMDLIATKMLRNKGMKKEPKANL